MIEKGINWYNSVHKNDKPDFDPDLNNIRILFEGYDLKREIQYKVNGINDWFNSLK